MEIKNNLTREDLSPSIYELKKLIVRGSKIREGQRNEIFRNRINQKKFKMREKFKLKSHNISNFNF